jgi:hypothetical protein
MELTKNNVKIIVPSIEEGWVLLSNRSKKKPIPLIYVIRKVDRTKEVVLLRSTVQEDGSLKSNSRRVRFSTLSEVNKYPLVSYAFMDDDYVRFCKEHFQGRFISATINPPLAPPEEIAFDFDAFHRYYHIIFPNLTDSEIIRMWTVQRRLV